MFAFLSQAGIEMKLDYINNLLRVIWLLLIEILNVVRYRIYFFLRSRFDFLFILFFSQYSIHKYFNFIIILLSLLFSEGGSPIKMYFRDDYIMQFVVIIVIFEQLFGFFKILDFYLIVKLSYQKLPQLPDTLKLIVLKEVMNFHKDVLLIIFALQKRKGRFNVTVYSLNTWLQSRLRTR